MSGLFREEAIKFRALRLQGEVFLAIRLHWLMLGLVCSGLVIGVLATFSFSTFVVKNEVMGKLVFKSDSWPVLAGRSGSITRVGAGAGERVAAGKVLVELSLAAGDDSRRADSTAGPSSNSACIPRQSGQSPARLVAWIRDRETLRLLTCDSVIMGRLSAFEGQQVSAGETLFHLLADQGRLEAELRVAPNAIASIREGQPVTLRFTGSPRGEVETRTGKIISVTAVPVDFGTSTGPQRPGGGLWYVARVGLTGPDAAGIKPLFAGMEVQADIILGTQSGVEWLFGQKSLKEIRIEDR